MADSSVTGASYFSLMAACNSFACLDSGWAELSTTAKGLPRVFSSRITCSSAGTYASRGSSATVPSVVTATPTVA